MTTKLDHAKLWRQIGEGLSPKKSQALSLDHGQHGGRVRSRVFLKTFGVFSERCDVVSDPFVGSLEEDGLRQRL